MTPTTLLVAIMVAALVLYVLFGGADFGAGVWDLFSSGPQKAAQRALIASAVQPIWEANHVWLILIFVLLFSGFLAPRNLNLGSAVENSVAKSPCSRSRAFRAAIIVKSMFLIPIFSIDVVTAAKRYGP